MTRSRIQKINILEIEISDLHNLKKHREELDSGKRIEESKLVKVEKGIEDQIKQINEAKRKYEHHGDRHSNKINELKIRSKHHQENIDQLYNEISLEEEWAKESKLRLREILNEKIVWQQETKVLKDEKKALFEQISLLKSETETACSVSSLVVTVGEEEMDGDMLPLAILNDLMYDEPVPI